MRISLSSSTFRTACQIVVMAEEDGTSIFTKDQQVWIENLVDRRAGRWGVLTEGVDMSYTQVYPGSFNSVESGSGLVGGISVPYIYCISVIYGSF